MVNKNLIEIEKWIKSNLKKKVSVTQATVITFLMTGTFMSTPLFAADISNEQNTLELEQTESEEAEAKRIKEKAEALKKLIASGELNREMFSGMETVERTSVPSETITTYSGQDRAAGQDRAPAGQGVGVIAGNTMGGIGGWYVIGDKYREYGNHSVSFGTDSLAGGDKAIAIGSSSRGSGEEAISLGAEAKASNFQSIALGSSSKASGRRSVAVGSGTVSEAENAIVIGTETFVSGTSINSVAIGTESGIRGRDAVALGKDSHIGVVDANADNATAIGTRANAVTRDTIAFGTDSYAENLNAISIGTRSRVDSDNSMAIGTNSRVIRAKSIALGANSSVASTESVAVGAGATIGTGYKGSTAIGGSVKIRGAQGTSVGYQMYSGKQATSIGNDSIAYGLASIAIGSDDIAKLPDGTTVYTDELSIATKNKIFGTDGNFKLTDAMTEAEFKKKFWGTSNKKYSPTLAYAPGAITIGARSIAYGKGSTSMGTLAFALGENSTAMGFRSFADEDGGIAVGEEARSFAENGLAIGSHSESSGAKSSAYGNYARAVGNGALAIGDNVVANGMVSNWTEFKDTIKNNSNGTPNLDNALTTINNNKGQRENYFNYVEGGDSYLEIGSKSVKKTNKVKDHAVSLGHLVLSTGKGAVGIGTATFVDADNSIGLGSLALVDTGAHNSVAMGTGANVLRQNSMALGVGAKATLSESVSLGYKSVTDYDENNLTANAYSMVTDDFTIPAGNNVGVISVGSKTNQRRISNLAPGREDTDAVNVQQLKGVKEYIDTVALPKAASIKLHGENNQFVEGDDFYLSTDNAWGNGDSRFIGENLETYAYTKDGKKTILVGMKTRPQFREVTVGKNDRDANAPTVKLSTNADGLVLDNKKISGVAPATLSETSTEAVNGSQLNATNQEVANKANKDASNLSPTDIQAWKDAIDTDTTLHYVSVNSTNGANFNNDGAKGQDAIAIGKDAKVEKADIDTQKSIAIGANTLVEGDYGIALGAGENSTDARTKAGANAIALGRKAQATGAHSMSMGYATVADAEMSMALGRESQAKASGGVAIGNLAKVAENIDGGVALGQASLANRAKGSKGWDILTNSESTATDRTWMATRAAVSVGSDGEYNRTRQIINVAAGSEDTDAVNVAQLKKTREYIDNVGWNVEGKGALPTNATAQNKGGKITADETVNFVNGTATTADVKFENNKVNVKYDIAYDDQTLELKNGKLSVKNTGVANVNKITGTGIAVTNDGDLKTGDVNLSVSKSGFTTAADGTISATTTGDTFATAEDVATQLNKKIEKKDIKNITSSDSTVTIGTNANVAQGEVDLKVNFGTVTENNTQAVKGGDVFTAIEGSKSQVTGDDIINVTKTAGEGIANDSFAVTVNNDSIDKSKLNEATRKEIEAKSREVVAVEGAGLSVTDDGATKVDPKTDNKTFTVKLDKDELAKAMVADPTAPDTENKAKTALEEGLDLTYKANGANGKTTSLKDGLNFTNGTTTVATVGDNGEVTFDLNTETKKAIAESENSPFEFVDAAGNKLTKVGDKYYTDNQLNSDGTPKDVNDSTEVAKIKAKVMKPVTNIASNLPGAEGVVSNPAVTEVARTAPTNLNDIKNNAATVSDVLNAGWNLQGNGTAVDFVKAYDTVNFVDGDGTTARVTTDANNKVNKITFDIAVDNNTTKLVGTKDNVNYVKLADGSWKEYDAATGEAKKDPNAKTIAKDDGDLVEDVKVVAVQTPATAASTETVKAGDGVSLELEGVAGAAGTKYTVKAKVDNKTLEIDPNTKAIKAKTIALTPNTTDGTVSVPEANKENLVTAGAVADAINNSGFKVKANEGAEELVKTGETVTFKDGQNISITRAGKVFTVATKADLLANSVGKKDGAKVTFGEDSITLGKGTEPVELAGVKSVIPEATAEKDFATQLTETAAAKPNSAVNVKDLKAVADMADEKSVETVKHAEESKDFLTVEETTEPAADTNKEWTVKLDKVELAKAMVKDIPADTTANPDAEPTENAAETALEKGLDLTYKANGANGKTTSLKEGLNFTDGANTVASVGDNGEVVFDLKKNIDLSTPSTIEGGEPINDGSIDGLKNHLPESVGPQVGKPSNISKNQAATVDDVLNAGWNLEGNGTAVDFVKAYDTVNFVNGKGTKANVSVNKDTGKNEVSYDVKVDNATIKTKQDGTLYADIDVPTVNNTTGTINDGTDTSKPAGTVSVVDENSYLKAGETAKLINGSFHTVKNTDTDNLVTKAEGSTKIKSGSSLTIEAGKNLASAMVTESGLLQISTKDTVDFKKVTITDGDDKTTTSISNNGIIIQKPTPQNGKKPKVVALTENGLDNGGNKITNVAAGTNNTDAVNLKQLNDEVAKSKEKVIAGNGVSVKETPATETEGAKFEVSVNTDGKTTEIVNKTKDGKKVVKHTDGNWYVANEDGSADTTQAVVKDNVESIVVAKTTKLAKGENTTLAGDGSEDNPYKVSLAKDINLSTPATTQGGAPTYGSITGLTHNITPVVSPTTQKVDAPTISDPDKHKAATVGDVLNAGWNLSSKSGDTETYKDFVKPYDEVVFADGKGTAVTVTNTDGKRSEIKYDVKVDGTTISVDETTGALKAIIPENNGMVAFDVLSDEAGKKVTVKNPSAKFAIKGADKGGIETKVDGNTITVGLNKTTKDDIAEGKKHASVVKGTNVTSVDVSENPNAEGGKEYVVNVKDMNLKSGSVDYNKGILTLTNADDTKVTVAGIKDTKVTDLTLTGDTLILKQNNGESPKKVDLSKLRINIKVDGKTIKKRKDGTLYADIDVAKSKEKVTAGNGVSVKETPATAGAKFEVSVNADNRTTEIANVDAEGNKLIKKDGKWYLTKTEVKNGKVTTVVDKTKEATNLVNGKPKSAVTVKDGGIGERELDPYIVEKLRRMSKETVGAAKGQDYLTVNRTKFESIDGEEINREFTVGLNKDNLAKAMVADGSASKNTLETGLDLTYKANGKDAKTTSLKDGLNFVGDGVIKITTGDNGEVRFDAEAIEGPFGRRDENGNPLPENTIRAKGKAPQRVTNIAAGIEDTDAVNVSQLRDVKSDVDGLKGGLAGASAMAGIKFMDIGINQAQIGAAVGAYRGKRAVAVGMQVAPTVNTRVHAQISAAPQKNHSETMANVGATWRFNWK